MSFEIKYVAAFTDKQPVKAKTMLELAKGSHSLSVKSIF